MMLPHQSRQSLGEHMRVKLRCADIGMPEHLLHAAKIGAMREQMAGESVPQHMWRDGAPVDPDLDGQGLQFLGKALAAEVAIARWEQPRRSFLGFHHRSGARLYPAPNG